MTSILKVTEIQDPTNSNTALSIDSSGNLTAPQRFSSKLVFAHIHASSSQSFSNATTAVVSLDAAKSDRFNFADLTNNQLTVPTGMGGFYWIEASVRLSNFTATRNVITVRQNTNTLFADETVVGASGTGEYPWVKASFICEIDAGDDIDFTFYHNYGSSQSTYAGGSSEYYYHNYLKMMKLGD